MFFILDISFFFWMFFYFTLFFAGKISILSSMECKFSTTPRGSSNWSGWRIEVEKYIGECIGQRMLEDLDLR
jgi:hypothetical protein